MRSDVIAAVLFAVVALGTITMAVAEPIPPRPWPTTTQNADTLARRFPPPAGFQRTAAEPRSFAAWLRGLPLKPQGSAVLLHTGSPKWRQDVHAAVIDIDTGPRDLQQCADAIMRLRAEWLWSIGAKNRIAFDYTGGGRVPFSRGARGERPSESGKSWSRGGKADDSYAAFRRYLTGVFTYAGTYSLERELRAVPDGETLQAGDVFIKGGFPGHAVIVADVVENPRTGEQRVLLMQSFMPAQDIHVLKNPAARDGSPWYAAPVSWPLATPEWTFPKGSLKRWAD
ncbi:MAG: DUF4846 domain-containing protein [Hyphomicrobiaceae bacterium]